MTRFASVLILLAACAAAWAAPVPPPVVVTLVAEKEIPPAGKDGQPMWQPLTVKTTVLPGDILRYTVTGSNHLSRPIQGFVLTQPVPHGTEYRAPSAEMVSGAARMTVSLDGGKTYAEKPMVKSTLPDGTTRDEPAPASRYTDIRWTLVGDLPASAAVSARCEVRVR